MTFDFLRIRPLATPLLGEVAPATDKSITHRALFFAALNGGRTIIHDPSPAADCASTLGLLAALGYPFAIGERRWELHGGGMREHAPGLTLDCGNSGTTARLAAGFLTGERGSFTLVGDGSLASRPMERVASPLSTLGASVTTSGGHLPLMVTASRALHGLPEGLAINAASAQVHASLVLALLRSDRGGSIRRTKPMRDHTIRMARLFGASVATEIIGGDPVDQIAPSRIGSDVELRVPGDLSSASFLIGAALLVPGSSVRLVNVGLNPTRIALLETLAAMGARLRWEVEEDSFEPVGSVTAGFSPDMTGITLDEASPFNVAEMLDELPLLALLAARARGRTLVRDAAELRVKESDRITATARMLASLGLTIEEREDGFAVEGAQRIAGGNAVDHHGDHRLCMVAALAALVADAPVTIPDPGAAAVSYPGFWNDLASLAGGSIGEPA